MKKTNNKKILLVDDEPDITSSYSIGLEDTGFVVDSFNDPLLALEAFKQTDKEENSSYALALLDIKMPKMNGFELFNEIRKVNDKIKVCFVTAFDPQKEDKDLKIMMPSALNNNNEKPVVIRKPISIDDFVERVKAEILLQNISQSSSRQIHFLICETCFWCASLLYQIPDRTTILNWHTCKDKIIRSYALA